MIKPPLQTPFILLYKRSRDRANSRISQSLSRTPAFDKKIITLVPISVSNAKWKERKDHLLQNKTACDWLVLTQWNCLQQDLYTIYIYVWEIGFDNYDFFLKEI